MKTSSAKNKGRTFQQACAKLLSDIFNWEDGDVESRPMGSAGIDLMMSPKAKKDYPFSIECKNTKTFPSWSGLEQAQANAKPGTIGVMVWKAPRRSLMKQMICMDHEEFAKLWKEHNVERKDD